MDEVTEVVSTLHTIFRLEIDHVTRKLEGKLTKFG